MDHGKADRLVRNLKPKLKLYDQALGNSMSCRVTADGAGCSTFESKFEASSSALSWGIILQRQSLLLTPRRWRSSHKLEMG